MFGNQAGIVLTKVPHGACKAAPGLTARQTSRQRKRGREREGREADNPLDKAKQSSKVSLLNVRGSTGDLN